VTTLAWTTAAGVNVGAVIALVWSRREQRRLEAMRHRLDRQADAES
jgi:HAMP domain-containing protein